MTVEAKMKAVLDELDFDFSQFTMDSFVDWIEEQGTKDSLYPLGNAAGDVWRLDVRCRRAD